MKNIVLIRIIQKSALKPVIMHPLLLKTRKKKAVQQIKTAPQPMMLFLPFLKTKEAKAVLQIETAFQIILLLYPRKYQKQKALKKIVFLKAA